MKLFRSSCSILSAGKLELLSNKAAPVRARCNELLFTLALSSHRPAGAAGQSRAWAALEPRAAAAPGGAGSSFLPSLTCTVLPWSRAAHLCGIYAVLSPTVQPTAGEGAFKMGGQQERTISVKQVENLRDTVRFGVFFLFCLGFVKATLRQ